MVQKGRAMVRIAALLAATLLLYSPSVFAWGGLAHETICEIGFLELNDTARQRVIELIQQDEEFRTFRASCNWPDRPPRKLHPSTSSMFRAIWRRLGTMTVRSRRTAS